jgi:hypothetical protein
MGCAAFTILGVYVAASNRGNAWVVGGSALLAVMFFAVAAYRTWRDEYNKYEGEVAKNQQPEIKGEAFDFSGYGRCGDGQYRGHWSANTQVKFELFLCNHRPTNTTLRGLELDGSHLLPAVSFDLEPDLPADMELLYGVGMRLTVHATATVYGMRLTEVPPIKMNDLVVLVTDAFDQRHRIQVRDRECLRFGSR